MSINILIYNKKHVNRFLAILWLVSLVLVLLTTFTPLEFNPIQLTYLPRWGLWFLVIPATQWLRTSTGILPWLWKSIPWLLWVPLLTLQLAYSIQTYTTYPNYIWNIRFTLIILEQVFSAQLRTPFERYTWHTNTIYCRWKNSIDAQQLLLTPYGGEPRRVIITSIILGLEWCEQVPDDIPFYSSEEPIDAAKVPIDKNSTRR